MKTLHLPLKAQWYEMIESLLKEHEYRDFTPFWIQRLCIFSDGRKIIKKVAEFYTIDILKHLVSIGRIKYITYDAVKFSYGYTKRTMTFKFEGITIGKGKPEWGAPENEVFIIKLGQRIE